MPDARTLLTTLIDALRDAITAFLGVGLDEQAVPLVTDPALTLGDPRPPVSSPRPRGIR